MKITCNINTIGDAVKALKKYRKGFDKNVNKVIKTLTMLGYKIAVKQVAEYDGITIGTIMYVEENKGVIFANGPYVAFVEFGTGVTYNDPGSYPGKKPDGIAEIGEYGQGKGKQPYWVYFSEMHGKVMATAGMPAHPFMYNTLQELGEKAAQVAKEVFKA